jgi:hypothetical protein
MPADGSLGRQIQVAAGGGQRGIQDNDGNIKLVVANKFMISKVRPMPRRSSPTRTQAVD